MEIKNLFDAGVKREIIDRINKVTGARPWKHFDYHLERFGI